jgi:hypothetical protein
MRRRQSLLTLALQGFETRARLGDFNEQRLDHHDDDRKAALKAADAVFRKGGSAASAPETAPSSNAPAGRILPSLIAADDAPAVRSADADEKSRRGRGPERPRGHLSSGARNQPSNPKVKLREALWNSVPGVHRRNCRLYQGLAASADGFKSVGFWRRSSSPGRNGSGACARLRADFGLSFIFQATVART